MSGQGRDHDRRGDAERALYVELRRRVPGPDLTGPVMRRLGLAPSGSQAGRRRRLRRAAARLALVVAAVGASAAGVLWHLGDAGTPPGPTIPSAIRHDLQRGGHTIDRAIRSIRELAPRRPVVAPAPVPDPEPQGPSRLPPGPEARPASPRV